jgi:hypothetical protein
MIQKVDDKKIQSVCLNGLKIFQEKSRWNSFDVEKYEL